MEVPNSLTNNPRSYIVRFSSFLPVVALSLAACGGGGDSSGGTNPPPSDVVSSVSLTRTSASVRPTEAVTITATPRNSNGAALSGKTVTWTVSQTGTIVNITPSGASVQITGAALGTAQVTATVEGKTASAAITVVQSFPSTANVTVGNNNFNPADLDINAGGSVTWTWAQGAVDHNVTFESGNPATVSTITTRSTGSDSRTFGTAGVYSYVCTIHQGMNGTVVVH